MTDIDTVTTSNGMQLSGRPCLGLLIFTAAFCLILPALWPSVERLETGPDYRIPYAVGNDYWLYDRWAREASRTCDTLLVGDSVVWGHFVAREQTLSHHMNAVEGSARFANLGVDGSHPAALAGLIEFHGKSFGDRKIVLLCNPTWMASTDQDLRNPDLRRDQVFPYNHAPLIPQFRPAVPCYRETFSGRIGHVLDRNLPFNAWTRHLQVAYYENKSIPAWTLDHPYENPLKPMTLRLGPADDRLEESISWTERGIRKQDTPWVDLESSLQWGEFRRTVRLLRSRGNPLLVVVGPYNEHLLTEPSLKRYLALKKGVEAWLASEKVPHLLPPPLPSGTYADASHPLDAGYALMARQVLAHEFFKR